MFVALLCLIFSPGISSKCLGEFQQCESGECANSPNDCGKYCRSSDPYVAPYVCPISKRCIDSVADYPSCPGLKGTHLDTSLSLQQRLDFLIENLSLLEKVSQLTHNASEILRFGIPSYNWLNDDVHSVRNAHATVFPNGNGIGATFDRTDAYITAHTVAIEARGLHADLVHSGDRGSFNGAGITAYGPNMNLVRDPRWGRSQEVFSEDPRLTAHLTHHFVRGYQYGGAQEDKYILMTACCKHFAAYDLDSNPQDRVIFDAIVDAVDWAETYSPVFRECVTRSKGQSVMCSYNKLNSVPTCGSADLLTTVLRDEWGFEGFVVSDYDAMANILNTQNYTKTMAEAVALSIRAGCDQEGGGTEAIDKIPDAIAQGLMTEEDVNLAFRRLYRTKLMLGFFDAPLDVEYNNISSKLAESEEHLNLSRMVAQDSIALYKNNDHVLPLDPETVKGVFVVGPQAIEPIILTGNYANYPDKGCKTILEGLRSGLGENTVAKCNVSFDVEYYQPGVNNSETYVISYDECCSLCFESSWCYYWTFYQNVCYFKQGNRGRRQGKPGMVSGACLNKDDYTRVYNANGCNSVACQDTSGFDDALSLIRALGSRGQLSAIVVLLGLDVMMENEGNDRASIELPGYQNELVTQIYTQNHDDGLPIICVLIHGGAVALGAAAEQCDAILDAWYPGQMGGYAIADVIFGFTNPGGRAAVTYYKSTDDLPMPGQMSEYYGKGVTYRYFTGTPLYPFGFGLSYTEWSYSNLRTNATNQAMNGCDVLQITVTVKNVGNVTGDEVIQLYVNQSLSATVPVPQIRLADFARIKNVKPGESQQVQLILTPRYHSVVYNETSPTYFEPDVWIEKGAFMIYVGGGQPAYYKGTLAQKLTVSTAQPLSKCENQN